MDGEEDIPHLSEDLFSECDSSAESKKREAKGTCLKIEGQEGYVLKSYSIHPHDLTDAKSPSCSSTLDKDSLPTFHLSSQVDKQLELEKVCDIDPSSPNGEGHIELEKYANGSGLSGNIKDHIGAANGMEEEMQDDERLAFGSSIGPFLTRDCDDYNNLLSGYTSTLYDVAMDAVTQSLLSSMRGHGNPRKKSPAWNHFCTSPRDNTKAICLYCMKEFSRGKNEKDLSTSCLMRHDGLEIKKESPLLITSPETISDELPQSIEESMEYKEESEEAPASVRII
ncbi:hypothetical protein CRENBAI_001955 [Crenichthys baileyi]|uniref:BED-type domain-containing protein n=1 Tax=Crenichthys baileyi TaxID=28760 RepID=A0AAV9RNQ3_9TELE